MGLSGREYTLANYNYQTYCDRWVQLLENIYEDYGSWNHPDGRKNYKGWEHIEL